MLNNISHKSFNLLLTQDFPYLLYKTKININQFFNITLQEQYIMTDEMAD